MTIKEKALKALESTDREIKDLTWQIEQITLCLGDEAHEDAYGMTPGIGTAHTALKIGNLATRLKAAKRQKDMLEYILREDD